MWSCIIPLIAFAHVQWSVFQDGATKQRERLERELTVPTASCTFQLEVVWLVHLPESGRQEVYTIYNWVEVFTRFTFHGEILQTLLRNSTSKSSMWETDIHAYTRNMCKHWAHWMLRQWAIATPGRVFVLSQVIHFKYPKSVVYVSRLLLHGPIAMATCWPLTLMSWWYTLTCTPTATVFNRYSFSTSLSFICAQKWFILCTTSIWKLLLTS